MNKKLWPKLSAADDAILERLCRGLAKMPLSSLEREEAKRYMVYALDRSKEDSK